MSYSRLIPVTVRFDDLDALGLLHNARCPLMVERAWALGPAVNLPPAGRRLAHASAALSSVADSPTLDFARAGVDPIASTPSSVLQLHAPDAARPAPPGGRREIDGGTQLWQEHGFRFAGDWGAAGDACNAVKELRISHEAPVTAPGTHAVHLWLERLGSTGLTYGFRFCSADAAVTYAHGSRVLVRLDAGTLRSAPWSEGFRAVGRELLHPVG